MRKREHDQWGRGSRVWGQGGEGVGRGRRDEGTQRVRRQRIASCVRTEQLHTVSVARSVGPGTAWEGDVIAEAQTARRERTTERSGSGGGRRQRVEDSQLCGWRILLLIEF